jgi:hypothetical protein
MVLLTMLPAREYNSAHSHSVYRRGLLVLLVLVLLVLVLVLVLVLEPVHILPVWPCRKWKRQCTTTQCTTPLPLLLPLLPVLLVLDLSCRWVAVEGAFWAGAGGGGWQGGGAGVGRGYLHCHCAYGLGVWMVKTVRIVRTVRMVGGEVRFLYPAAVPVALVALAVSTPVPVLSL